MNRFFAIRKKKDKKEQSKSNDDDDNLNDADLSLLNQLVPTSTLISSHNTDNNNINKNGEIIDYIDDVATVNYINTNDYRKKSTGSTISTTGSSSKSNNFLSVDSCYASIQPKQNLNLLSPNQANERINEKHRRPSIFDYMNEQDIDSETENQLLKSTKTPCSTVSNSSNDFVETSTTTLNTTNEKSMIKSFGLNKNNKGPKNITYSISS